MKQADDYNLHSLSVAPKNIFYWRTRAKMMYLFDTIDPDKGYYAKGVEAVEKAIRLAPTDPRLYYTYATIEMMHAKGTTVDSQKKSFLSGLFEQAISLKPNYRDAYISLGQWYEQIGEKEKAKENYKIVIEKINPSDQEALDGILRN
jgi:tetratricopeptide (TPR) repeat protein